MANTAQAGAASVTMTGSSTHPSVTAEQRGVQRVWQGMQSYFHMTAAFTGTDNNPYAGQGLKPTQ